jgi:predicted RNase H-like HicB family nuclease
MSFNALLHPEPSGGYWGEVPALPGCYSQGETVEELLANLREAAAGCLEVLTGGNRENGDKNSVSSVASCASSYANALETTSGGPMRRW